MIKTKVAFLEGWQWRGNYFWAEWGGGARPRAPKLGTRNEGFRWN